MKQFERELTALKRRVVEMGKFAASMVARASNAMFAAEHRLIAQVLADEPNLDRLQVEIDGEAIRLITIYSPVARDLRFLLMIVRINSELERIGDQAVDNCEYAELLAHSHPPLADLQRMSTMVLAMLQDALQALDEEDSDAARAVLRADDEVDALNRQIFRDLLDHPAADAESRAGTLSLILIARSLERIADHATNIGEEVFYAVEGADIRHQT